LSSQVKSVTITTDAGETTTELLRRERANKCSGIQYAMKFSTLKDLLSTENLRWKSIATRKRSIFMITGPRKIF